MTRPLLAAILLVCLGVAVSSAGRPALAAPLAPPAGDIAPASIQEGSEPESDDDVVEVQLVVLGIVIGTVFVLGSAAFLLRRRLGLTAYTPPADTGHH